MSSLPPAAEIQEDQALRIALAEGGRLRGLPAPVEHAFRRHYRTLVSALLRKYISGLAFLHSLCLVPILLFWSDPSLKPWALICGGPVALCIGVAWAGSRLRNLEQHIDLLLGASMSIALFAALAAAMHLNGQPFGELAKYQAVYILIVVFNIMQMPLRLFVPGTIAAVLLALAVATLAGSLPALALDVAVLLAAVPFWLEFCLYCLIPAVLCAITSYILENSEKRNFVQQQLLQRESARLAELNAATEANLQQQRASADYLALISGNLALKELFTRTLRFLVEHTGAQVAAGYHLSSRGTLRRVATWAVDAERLDERKEVEPETTLMGPALASGELLHLTQLRADYLPIDLGMGRIACTALLIVPVVQAGKPLAVIELGRLGDFNAEALARADAIRAHLAYAVTAANAREIAVRSSMA